MPSPDTKGSIDETIAAAVHARIEAEVFEALSGDAVIGQFVAAALRVTVETSGSYKRDRVPYLKKVLDDAIRKATMAAVNSAIAGERDRIEEEVRKALKREAPSIASVLVGALAEQAGSRYGMSLKLELMERE